MNKPDRRVAPPVHEVRDLLPPTPTIVTLDNGLPVQVLDFPDQETLKVEMVYWAGRSQETRRVSARATARLLREGTTQRPGAEVAEHFDFYGASFSSPGNLDTSAFALGGLRKYAAELLPVFAEVLQQPAFPEHELATFQQTNVQELQVELEKPEVLAYRTLTERIFGADHAYGYNSMPEDYHALTRADLLDFYQRQYTPQNGLLMASGRIDDEVLQLLNRYFGQQPLTGQPVVRTPALALTTTQVPKRPLKVVKAGSLQAAIKMGRPLFNRQHPDYHELTVLNTVLGGYFGSRLMSQIREKKGYTYGIYSSIETHLSGGYWQIATDVNADKLNATLRAIRTEMKRLREQSIPAEELEMVRSYLLGVLLTSLDGPLNIAELVRTLMVEEIGFDGFARQVATIRSITPERLQELAVRYLQPEDWLTVVVGPE